MNSTDDKIQYLRCISFRNLYEETGTNTPHLEDPSSSVDINVSRTLQLNERKLLDSFFSLHALTANGKEILIYVSEVNRYNMNPNFAQISLPYIPNTKNNGKLVVRLWTKKRDASLASDWSLLIHLRIKLSKLVFFGTVCDNLEDEFHNNSIILNLNGRFYTLPESLKYKDVTPVYPDEIIAAISPTPTLTYTLNSYTFDSIRSMINLSRSIDELRISKFQLNQQISEYMSRSPVDVEYEIARLRKKTSQIAKSIVNQKLRNEAIEGEIHSIRIKLNQYKQLVDEKKSELVAESDTQREIITSQIDPINDMLLNSAYPNMLRLLSEHVQVLEQAIQIKGAPNSSNFTIMDIEFPSSIPGILQLCNAQNEDNSAQNINAGLSYISQMLNVLAALTNTTLKYPIVSSGDESIIIDPITHKSNAVIYPLYYDTQMCEKVIVGTEEALKNPQFETALGLLNKNLALIMATVKKLFQNEDIQVPIDCYDNFLWNLHYLVLFITAP